MSAFLPALEDTLVDLLQYGDTGVLRVALAERRWSFYVQGGVLTGVEREPALPEPAADPTAMATGVLVEAMTAKGALWDFDEGASPDELGLYDVRRALADALGQARPAFDLMRALQPVLDGWPELTVDADTLSGDPAVQRWLQSLDGLGPGNTRLLSAPPDPGPALGALWVAWKLGDLELHTGAIEDDDPSDFVERPQAQGLEEELAAVGSGGDPGEHHEEDTDGHDEETAQTVRTGGGGMRAADRRRVLEELAERNRDARPDGFLAGVAHARAGDAAAALPLLEEAWEADPERPGLEEWLGYTRFAACRDSDPDKARAGLGMLRDVMYRTGPSGEPAVLPWILMARAQLERGDLVQARSQLDAVLQREPDHPEAMHVDGELRKAEEEAARAAIRPEGVSLRRIASMTGGVVVLAAIAVSVQVVDRTAPRTDYSDQVAAVASLRELHRVSRGWIGVVAAGQAVPEASLPDTCEAIAGAVAMDDYETLLLLSDEGLRLAECGVRLAADPPPPAATRQPAAPGPQ